MVSAKNAQLWGTVSGRLVARVGFFEEEISEQGLKEEPARRYRKGCSNQ